MESTRRERTCIICQNRTETGEHIFPSALGGRRTDKGIYCKTHNQGLGPLVVEIQNQLLFFNARLEVMPDRGIPKPVRLEGEKGEPYLILGSKVTSVIDLDEVLDRIVTSPGGLTRLPRDQLAPLRERAKERGLELAVSAREDATEFIHGSLNARLAFGGPAVMRSVAYLALTFAAHHNPRLIREADIGRAIKIIRSGEEYVQADKCYCSEQDLYQTVWWAAPSEEVIRLATPGELCHTVVVSVNQGRLLSHVSLFGLLNFMVDLGACESLDQSVITVIDPLALSAPNDRTVIRVGRSVLDPHLSMVAGSQQLAREAMEGLMNAIAERHAKIEFRDLVDAISAIEPELRMEAIASFMARRSQVFLNVICRTSEELKRSPATNPLLALIRIADECAMRDEAATSKLSNRGAAAIKWMEREIAAKLLRLANDSALSFAEYRDAVYGVGAVRSFTNFLQAELFPSSSVS